MNIGIYARKSKLTETGDSIKNQIKMCSDYASIHFPCSNLFYYTDEGFSGGNTDRPHFKQLMDDILLKKIDILICYRLDRISRNVNDFSSTLKFLDYNNVSFVSITEQFDTSTPMGKAMLSIASVFAQLERDTTAQRITDNLTQLAKTGRYIVPNPPEGYITKKVTENNKHHNILIEISDELDKIKLLYEKYLTLQSITALRKFCISNNILTKNGKSIKNDWLLRILTHQLYCIADINAYNYFSSLNSEIISPKYNFNGDFGVTVYHRTEYYKGYHTKISSPENLIIGIGNHKGIIPSSKWIEVQNIIALRKNHIVRNTTGSIGILNGILVCNNCNNFLRPSSIRNNTFRYSCTLREKSSSKLCHIKSIKGIIDNEILVYIFNLFYDDKNYYSLLKLRLANISYNTTYHQNIKNKINSNNIAISNLVSKLSETNSSALIKAIETQVELLDNENKVLLSKLNIYQNLKNSNAQPNDFLNFDFNNITDTKIKRNIIKKIIDKITWNEENLYINFKV